MAFVQLIEWRTKKPDEIMKLEHEWRDATEGRRTLRRSIVARDRNDPDRYFVIAFFDSYESAMVNSNLPATGEYGARQVEYMAGPMIFTDLEVLEDLD
jgi:hypothetical protein